MSASNWQTCPRCLDRARIESDDQAAEVYAQYGKVSPEEFDNLRAGLPAVDVDDGYRTFREDYELWVEHKDRQAILRISYTGGCEKCGLSHRHESHEPLYDVAQEQSPKGEQ